MPETSKIQSTFVAECCSHVWKELAGTELFITGGTGFYGSWLVESLVAANDQLDLGASAVVLSRNPQSFLQKNPHLRGRKDLTFIAGDVRNFDFPDGKFTHVIHAATEASARLNREDPLLMVDTIVEGTRRALEFALHCGARQFLNTSSGAVYGDIPASIGPVPESFMGGPDVSNPKWAYGEGKRLSELLCAIYADKHGLETKNVRCFATIGPGLPLDTHFAIGNFIADALAGREIVIQGDGSAVRSYIDIADLTVWLWHVLVFGESKQAYNIGSEEGYSIREIAEKVRDVLAPDLQIKVMGNRLPNQLASHYVPSTAKARSQLGLSLHVPIDESIRATAGRSVAVGPIYSKS
jgi:nucleoside-diphosphate-sugar epimerase